MNANVAGGTAADGQPCHLPKSDYFKTSVDIGASELPDGPEGSLASPSPTLPMGA